MKEKWAIGVDIGGTKIEAAHVNELGSVVNKVRVPTDVKGGSSAIEEQILHCIEQLKENVNGNPVGIGVGIAAQIDDTQGVVRNAPNLGWHDVPFKENLKTLTKLPVVITNDVRAAAWGEWLFGAGKETTDMICMFVGTGVGGGVVCGGKMIEGCSNTAGEIGHLIVRRHGLVCHCGAIGCLESFAGGWAIGARAQEAAKIEPKTSKFLIDLAGGNIEDITAKHVSEAYKKEDLFASHIIHDTVDVLVDACTGLVNSFNPCRFILGGGVIEGIPEIIPIIDKRVKEKALAVATEKLSFLHAALGGDAGVIGAAALSLQKE